MEVSGIPPYVWIIFAAFAGVGIMAGVGYYVTKSLTGEKGASIASLLSAINDQMVAVRDDVSAVKGDIKEVKGDVERTRSELLGEIRSLDGRIRNVEVEQGRTQGMLNATNRPAESHR